MKCTVGLLRTQQGQARSLSGAREVLASWSWLELVKAGWSWLELVKASWTQLELIAPLLCSRDCRCPVELWLAWGVPQAGRGQWPDGASMEEQQPFLSQGGDTCHPSYTGPPEEPTRGQGRRNATPKPWAGPWDEGAAPMISVITFCFTLELLAQQDIRRNSTTPKKENK